MKISLKYIKRFSIMIIHMRKLSEDLIWDMRAFVYEYFAKTARAPSIKEVAAHFSLMDREAATAFEELHQRHAFFLEPGTHQIRMANPFSGVETSFKVHANGRTYFANCAWDSLGIPAALQTDAQIEAACSQSGEVIRLNVKDGQVSRSDVLIHFLVPFQAWYNDLGFT
jgi:hypothetical protein